MKKTLFRIVAILLILVLSSSSVISTTLAKYVTHGGAFTDEARVAKWGVEILTTIDSLFLKNYTSKNGDDVVISMDSKDVVAPGTGNFIEIDTVITGKPEVAFEVSNNADVELGDNWVDADGNYYCPLYFSVNGQELNGMQFTCADEFENWIEGEVARVIAQYEPGTDLSETVSLDEMMNITLSWRWAFDNDEYSNDTADTYLGIIGNAEISFAFTQSVVQIKEFDETYNRIQTYSLKDNNKILFGSYPQTDVTADMGETLNGMVNDPSENLEGWTSYNYPTGNMHYIDVKHDGQKYRGVYYTTYRNKTNQEGFNYTAGDAYWFRYDPIEWTILSQSNDEAFLLCNIALDSQPYQSEYYEENLRCYNSSEGVPKGIYASNYAYGTIRKWLNNDFYNTAFNNLQKRIVLSTNVKNDKDSGSLETDKYIDTQDRIFLLSYEEAIKGKYRLDDNNVHDFTYILNDENRKRMPTDYAKSQGIYTDSGNVWWYLRSPDDTRRVRAISHEGVLNKDRVDLFENGIVPALRISLSGDYKAYRVTERDSENNITKLEFGSYPQSEVKVTDDMTDDEKAETTALLSTLNAKAGDPTTDAGLQNWTSYGYYKYDEVGKVTISSDYMWYIDVTLDDGNKYRGVFFTEYRAYSNYISTVDESTEAGIAIKNAYQDNYGYYTSNVYWFRYDPIAWTILDFDETNGMALVVCESSIDAQAYQNTYVDKVGTQNLFNPSNGQDYVNPYGYSTIYANNYEYSTIRTWLNETFYHTAFTNLQKNIVHSTDVNNSFESTEATETDANKAKQFASNNTIDKVFLLSTQESKENLSKIEAKLPTDYAKSQGILISDNGGYWLLRSPSISTRGVWLNTVKVRVVQENVNTNLQTDAYFNYVGIRPAMWIRL